MCEGPVWCSVPAREKKVIVKNRPRNAESITPSHDSLLWEYVDVGGEKATFALRFISNAFREAFRSKHLRERSFSSQRTPLLPFTCFSSLLNSVVSTAFYFSGSFAGAAAGIKYEGDTILPCVRFASISSGGRLYWPCSSMQCGGLRGFLNPKRTR